MKKKIKTDTIIKKLKPYKKLLIGFLVAILIFLSLVFILKASIKMASLISGVLYLLFLIPTIYFKFSGKKATKGNKKKLVVNLLAIISFGAILSISAFSVFLTMIVIKAPEFDSNKLYSLESTSMYWADGSLIAKVGSENRENITYDDISENLINAIVATEDSRFFQHNGFDLPRFLVASGKQLLGNKNAGGASTLTMQVIKNTYTSTESKGLSGIIRKFTDIYMAIFKVEKHYTKEQIIEFYVNSNYLGGSAHGVEQASKTYFSKSAKDLTLPEAAMIAGLFNAPNYLDPLKYPTRTEKRRKTVLYLMHLHGYITDQEYEAAKVLTVDRMLKKSNVKSGDYQGVVDTITQEVEKKFGVNPYTTSMQIYTTFDKSKQDSLNNIMSGKNFKFDDIKVQTGIAILNSQNGAMLAIGTSRNSNEAARQYNFATQTKKQIGSTAKPLYDYGPAIEFQNWSSYSPVPDEPYTYSDGTPLVNWNRTYEGFLTARTALAGSRNIPAVKAFQANKHADIVKFVKGLGLSPEVANNGYLFESHALGGYIGQSPLEMAAAYAAFGNGGYYNEPYAISKIIYTNDNETWEYKAQKTRAMSEQTAYIIYDMLKSTCQQGIGQYCGMIGKEVGVKTGTTNHDDKTMAAHPKWPRNAINDSWVDGVNSEYAVSIWYGYDRLYDDYARTVLNISHWKLFYEVSKFTFKQTNSVVPKPGGILEVRIENETYPAMLPSANTPANLIVTELFKEGSEPTEESKRFKTLDNVSNLKAEYNNGAIKLSWVGIPTPYGIDRNEINNLGNSLFKNEGYRNNFINNRINYNNTHIGELVYRIYLKNEDGTLKEVGHTKDNNYTYFMKNNASKLNFIVKSSYSIFHGSNSQGASVIYNPLGHEIITNPLKIKLNGNPVENIHVGDKFNLLGVKVLYGTTDVTLQSDIKVTIVDKANQVVREINTLAPNKYTVTYKAEYQDYTASVKQIINVN